MTCGAQLTSENLSSSENRINEKKISARSLGGGGWGRGDV